MHALSHLQASSPAHFTGEDVDAQMVCHLSKATQQSWNRKPQGAGFWSQRFSQAPWGAWTILIPQTSFEARGLKPVKIQLVGGELATERWGKQMAPETRLRPGVPGAPRQRRVRDDCSLGTQASTTPWRGHVLSQATSLWVKPGS